MSLKLWQYAAIATCLVQPGPEGEMEDRMAKKNGVKNPKAIAAKAERHLAARAAKHGEVKKKLPPPHVARARRRT